MIGRLSLSSISADDLLVVENVGIWSARGVQSGEDFSHDSERCGRDDKPSKYPLMFHESRVLLINKMTSYPMWTAAWRRSSKTLNINPELAVFQVSCKTGRDCKTGTAGCRKG